MRYVDIDAFCYQYCMYLLSTYRFGMGMCVRVWMGVVVPRWFRRNRKGDYKTASVCPCAHLPVCASVRPSICVCVHPSMRPPICPDSVEVTGFCFKCDHFRTSNKKYRPKMTCNSQKFNPVIGPWRNNGNDVIDADNSRQAAFWWCHNQDDVTMPSYTCISDHRDTTSTTTLPESDKYTGRHCK